MGEVGAVYAVYAATKFKLGVGYVPKALFGSYILILRR